MYFKDQYSDKQLELLILKENERDGGGDNKDIKFN